MSHDEEYAGAGRPAFPKRAVVTGGMPYGNKGLHFGHIGGVFVHADVLTRFLKDRIGAENVIFVSGTDCYGSPIEVSFDRAKETGEFTGTLLEYVAANHERQKNTLRRYLVEPSLFAASALEPYVRVHERVGAELITTLHKNGFLLKITTAQFYDPEKEVFLNGRQVEGHCPVEGCRSEKGYADECSLGHQYDPKYLVKPRSVLTGARPEMRETTNWYIDMEAFRPLLEAWIKRETDNPTSRPFGVSALAEYLEPPTIHIPKNQHDALEEISEELPTHKQEEGRGKTTLLIFSQLADLEAAVEILGRAGVKYRTGKSLVPFRLTGNAEWGLAAPALDGEETHTFWVWPESLWAPISFTQAYLESRGAEAGAWKDWWCSPEAKVFQFIGEDNVYFYGHPQAAMFLGQQGREPKIDPPAGELRLTQLIANRHLLFLDKKASSSGKVKPPSAADLLEYYSAEELRSHFVSMALGRRGVNFRPKPLNPDANEREKDPVLKEGKVLANGLNRAARSCFYTVQKFYNNVIPKRAITPAVADRCRSAALEYEQFMYRCEFSQAFVTLEDLVKDANRIWSEANPYSDDCEEGLRAQTVADTFEMVRMAALLAHPIAPAGTENIRRHMRAGDRFFQWDALDQPFYSLLENPERPEIVELPPKTDFFEKNPALLA
ncbi:MAG: class I tRNA ligase family protein [Spirochaetales bacterium]